MLSPRKFAAGKKFLQRWQKAKKRQAKRGLRVESLEKRELMAADFHPSVLSALGTMRIPNQQTAQNIGTILESARTGSGGESFEGENNAPLTTGEVEPNNDRTRAQLLPLGNGPGQNAAVNVNGITSNLFDLDHFAFDLKKGDILDVRITTTGGLQPGLGLLNSQGRELLYSRGLFYPPAVGRPIADQSPRFTTGNATLSYIIDTDGRYFLSVADANLAYSLNLRTYRPTLEQEPIGTKQIVFLDFDGGFVRTDVLGLNLLSGQPPRTARVPAMNEILPALNLRPADEIPLARNIIARVEEKLRAHVGRVSGFNGFYSDTGNPGDFDIEIRNSYDHPDPWGQPNVSRHFVGGTNAQFGIPAAAFIYGIAESTDFGNFNHEETVLTLLDLSVGAALTTPRAGNVTAADVFAQDVADTIVHETGHILGAVHASATNNVFTVMDGFLFNTYGRDGLWGNADDEPLYFVNDAFDLLETTDGGGVNNLPQLIAFGASTGKVGGSIVGVAYNDKNRNGRQEQNEEGIANWDVFADLNNNGVRDASEPRTTSGANGAFALLVAPGTYNVRINRAASWIASVNTESVKSVTVTTSGSSTANFGSVLPSNIATGFKWLDLNADGVRDVNEPGLAGVYIYLDLDGDDRPDIGEPASVSAADGSFSLTPPRAGSFAIREVVEAGFRQTFPASGEHLVNYDGVNPLRGFNFGNAESADWGDAPAPYPTTRAQGGASHGATVGLRLGVEWDSDQDGQPSQNADADDTIGLIGASGVIDDEDGVAQLTPFVRADSANALRFNVTNTTGSPAYISGWMDFNGDGDWSDAGEKIVDQLPVSVSGVLPPQSFPIPANAVSRTFARFRLSQARDVGPAGRTATGEVEDYVFNIGDGPRTLLQDDTAIVARSSGSNLIDVLANDFALPGEPWSVIGVSTSIRGVRVTFDTATNLVNYIPPRNFIGTDEFTYTVRNASGRVETAKVTVSVLAQFLNPLGVDDSIEVPTNSSGFPLDVLANDIEGRGGALAITSVQYTGTGSVTIGSGGLSIRYTPAPNFGGTEFFQYTATDALGESTTANVTVHTIPGAFTDNLAAFSFRFFNLAGQPITEIRQGEQFRVSVYVDDLRPEIEGAKTPPVDVQNPGVFSAYLDMLYNSGLVAPASPVASNGFDFQVAFASPYLNGQGGSAGTPGVIDELGAFVNSTAAMDSPDPLKVADLVFNANNAGLAEFVGDPADRVPASDVTFYNEPRSTVSKSRISYGRSRIEIVPNTVNFPFAVDDSARLDAGTSLSIDVLRNDIVGSSAPIRIVEASDPTGGQVFIDRKSNPRDDRIVYTRRTDFTGTDQFQYVIQDARGFRSTATVTVQVGTRDQVEADDKLHLRLSVTNLAGEEITEITRGSEFQLRGFVKDLVAGDTTRPNVDGVFAAFQDILYSSGLVSVKSSATAPFFQVSFREDGGNYQSGQSGDVRVPGLINEIGSFQSTSGPFMPVSTQVEEKLQFVITMVANPSALLNSMAEFIGNPADISPFHDTLMFDPTSPVPVSQIRYIGDSVMIVGAASGGGTGNGEGFTNLRNAYDVDDDGHVSAIDVLILVNSLNSGNGGLLGGGSESGASGESGERYYVDVDADGALSALDVLSVVNYLNNPTVPAAGEGEGEGEAAPIFVSNSQNAVFVDVPFAKLDTIDSVIDSIYSPMVSVENEEDEECSLADYFASIGDSTDEDLFSGLSDDILRNS